MSRFAVLGSYNWDASTTTHWSSSSGGAGGASVPASADNVFVDGSSGSSPVITITATANCADLNFTGAITPTLTGSGSTLNIYGSLTKIAAMTWSVTATLNFLSTTTGKTITSAGGTNTGSAVAFNGVGGGWTLQDAFILTSSLAVNAGTFVSNNQTISCSSLISSNTTNVRSISLGSSAITCTSNSNGLNMAAANLTFNAGTSVITFTGTPNFVGAGLTYYNVTFQGATSTVTGSNTFNVLTFTPGKTVSLTAGTTQTIASLSTLGTLGNVITLQSTSAGSPATISISGGTVVFNYCSIKDITATGGATFNAYNSTNVSGNTGINFLGGDPPTGYSHKIMGQLITKVNGVTPSKVNGV